MIIGMSGLFKGFDPFKAYKELKETEFKEEYVLLILGMHKRALAYIHEQNKEYKKIKK